MKETILKAPDITCGGCANSIKNVLGKIDGIEQIDVDVENKIIKIEHDENQIPRRQIEAALDDIGFPVE